VVRVVDLMLMYADMGAICISNKAFAVLLYAMYPSTKQGIVFEIWSVSSRKDMQI
jgi:hypothetical protein